MAQVLQTKAETDEVPSKGDAASPFTAPLPIAGQSNPATSAADSSKSNGKRQRDCPALQLDTSISSTVLYANVNNPFPKRQKITAPRPPTPYPFEDDRKALRSADFSVPSPLLATARNEIDALYSSTKTYTESCLEISQAMKEDIQAEMSSFKERAVVQTKRTTTTSLQQVAEFHDAITQPLQEWFEQLKIMQNQVKALLDAIDLRREEATRTTESSGQEAQEHIDRFFSTATSSITHGYVDVHHRQRRNIRALNAQLCCVRRSFSKTASTVDWLARAMIGNISDQTYVGSSAADSIEVDSALSSEDGVTPTHDTSQQLQSKARND